ncbi:hypothetical protein SY88_16165 [Clostridiales bacterium PH28_bin88]|nr:hypothetical protein SY88_16165 [Clostridiales bacterium PH28_bin88]
MKLVDFLSNRKAAIIGRWLQLLLDTYPPETARFLLREKDRFANPVGSTVHQGIEGLYDELLQGVDPAKVYPLVDQIARIRAVQDFSPSRALNFIFLLKKLIREELGGEISAGRVSVGELLGFESNIDDLALLFFDAYMECREKICEIRINEVKKTTHKLLQRANWPVDGSVDHQA